MKIKKIFRELAVLIVAGLTLTASIRSYAQGNISLYESFVKEDSIVLFVNGADENEECLCQIGTKDCTDVNVLNINENNIGVRTLLLLDNSASITKEERGKIADFLQNIISDRLSGEEIAIATFADEVSWICDYSSDYTVLKDAIDSLSYESHDAYLFDVLYELVEGINSIGDDIFNRIIVISDGAEDKPIGYTEQELKDLLTKNPILIHSMGCQGKNNEKQLETLFSLSRLTNGQSFLLSDYGDVLDINKALDDDRNITRVEIYPDAVDMDGSVKSVKLVLGDESLSFDCRMPQVTIEEIEPEEPEVKEQEPVKDVVAPTVTTVVQPSAVTEEEPSHILLYILIAAVVIIVGLAAWLIPYLIKKNREKYKFETLSEVELRNTQVKENGNRTDMLSNSAEINPDDDCTCMIWNTKKKYSITLTDINSPAKSFTVPIENSIILGRKAESSDVAFDYEKTVSGKHCVITVREGKFFIKDLQSSNGTCVNDARIFNETEIYSGNILKLGRLMVRFEVR